MWLLDLRIKIILVKQNIYYSVYMFSNPTSLFSSFSHQVHVHAYISKLYINVSIYVYLYMYLYMYIYMYLYMCIHTYFYSWSPITLLHQHYEWEQFKNFHRNCGNNQINDLFQWVLIKLHIFVSKYPGILLNC